MPPDRNPDRELRDLGPHLDYPPTPDLARSVRGRLEAETEGPGSPSRLGPSLWWIAAAALVLLAAVPVFAAVLNNVGGAFSGGASAGGRAEGGSVAESGQQGGTDVAEPTQPPLAVESGASSADSSAAACASPEPILQARPARGAPGDEFSIRGRYFVAGFSVCDDTGSGSPAAAQTVPARDVRVEFLQNGRTWELGRFEANSDSKLATGLEVPADAGPGRAAVRATYGQGPQDDPYGQTSAEVRFFVLE